MLLFNMNEKVVLITGGYGHLGASICRGLSDCGAIVYVLGRSKEKFTSKFKENRTNIHFITCDISSTLSISQAFDEVHTKKNTIDVLINNAVYVRGQKPLEISDEDWAYSIDGVLNSVYRCIREIVPYFQKKGAGKILNISSMYGMVSPDFAIYDNSPDFLNPPYYGVAKAGVIQLTKYFAQYLGQYNIQINTVSPGPFPNETVQQDKQFIDALKKKTALKRIGNPDDLIGAIVFLSSNASDFVTGHNLVVDGGWTII